MGDCLFCKIANGQIPSEVVYQDDKIFVFKDINPKAPVHVIAIPRKHISGFNDIQQDDAEVMGHLIIKIPEIIKTLGLQDRGARLVVNSGREAGQAIFHLHFHIMGGRTFSWPPG